MEKINLNHITVPDKSSVRSARRKYQIWIDSRLYVFPSLVQAQRFLKMVSGELDLVRLECNQILSDCWRDYRLLWPYNGTSIAVTDALGQCRASLLEFDRSLQRTLHEHGANSHSFIFKDLGNCLDYAGGAYKELKEIYRLRSMTAEWYRVKIMENRLNDLAGRLNRIALDHPARVEKDGKLK